MRTFNVAAIRDYRVGVSLDLMGVTTGTKREWYLNFIGNYGFPSDPGSHHEIFPYGDFDGAMKRWKQLVKMYHRDALGVDRLKAFKKIWVPPLEKNHHPDDEAFIVHRDLVKAVMTSHGAKTRRRRLWGMTVEWSNPTIEPRKATKLLIPAWTLKPDDVLGSDDEAVPLSRMSERINELWSVTVKLYRAQMDTE